VFLTADQILAHLVGDYVLQSHWMATEKLKKSSAAFAHALVYTLCFLPISTSPKALAFILVTHFVIDRWRLARFACWLKNFLAPPGWASAPFQTNPPRDQPPRYPAWNYPWEECAGTGYPKDVPTWLSVWLLIIADNTFHLICNGVALKWLV
jgi:hypothetical protein